MRGLLSRYNEDRKNLFTKVGWAEVQALKLHQQERWVLDDLHEELIEQRQRLRRYDAQLEVFATSAPVAEREARAVLASMPWHWPGDD